MKHLKFFEAYVKPRDIGYVHDNVDIRIDIEKKSHAGDRQVRHGLDNEIEDGDIIETVELAIEELTISLMQDFFDIKDDSDRPVPFVIRNTDSFLNL